MKKTKEVKAYSRKTKSGKTVMVKAHTSSYNSSEEIAKDAMKSKRGSGKELVNEKNKGELDLDKIDAFKGDPSELSDKEQQAWQLLTGNYSSKDEQKLRKMKSLAKVWSYIDSKSKKKSSTKAPKKVSSMKQISDKDFNKKFGNWEDYYTVGKKQFLVSPNGKKMVEWKEIDSRKTKSGKVEQQVGEITPISTKVSALRQADIDDDSIAVHFPKQKTAPKSSKTNKLSLIKDKKVQAKIKKGAGSEMKSKKSKKSKGC